MRLFLLFFCISGFSSIGQIIIEPTGSEAGKEPHHRKALEIDELLKRNDPKGYKTLTAKSNYLVVANYRNGKRWRYFEGESLYFKTKKGRYFAEEISFIEDSTFTFQVYNKDIKRIEEFTFKPEDIAVVYKKKPGKKWLPVIIQTSGILVTANIDWINNQKTPYKNIDFLIIAPIVGIGNFLIFNHKTLFNRPRLGENMELKIIKPI